jgi:hypothetical protein
MRLKQEYHEFGASLSYIQVPGQTSLSYIMRSSLAFSLSLSKKKKTKTPHAHR